MRSSAVHTGNAQLASELLDSLSTLTHSAKATRELSAETMSREVFDPTFVNM